MRTETTAACRFLACICGLAVLSGIVSAQDDAQSDESLDIKVFSLSNAAAPEMRDVVDAIFGDAVAGIAVDKRTNSLIVKGRANVLQAVEAVLMKLDQHPKRPPRPKLATARQAGKSTPRLEIRSQVPGTNVIKKLIPSGTKVNKGDLLVELDDSQMIEALEVLRIEVEKLKAGDLVVMEQHLTAGPSGAVDTGALELKVAELRGKQVEAELGLQQVVIESEMSLASKTLEILQVHQQRVEKLAQTSNATSKEVHGVALEVAKAKTSLEVAVAKRKLLAEFIRPLRLAEAQLELYRAKAGLDHANRDAQLKSVQARAELHALRADFRLKTDQIARLEKQIANCRIFAPTSGVVRISQPSIVKEGAAVRDGQRLVYLESDAPPAPRY